MANLNLGNRSDTSRRENLAIVVKRVSYVPAGDALSSLAREIGLTNADFEVFEQVRDKTPAEPMRFE